MKRGLKLTGVSAGFTIIETMIVLAVTGFLFISILGTWSSRQHASEFLNSSQEVRSQIQQALTETQAGSFPNSGSFECKSRSPHLRLDRATQNAQGTNSQCVFLGKVIQFGLKNTDPEQFATFVIAGERQPTDPSQFKLAHPTVVTKSSTNANMNNLYKTDNLLFGMSAVKMVADPSSIHPGGSNTPVGAMGFLSEMGTLGANGGYVNGGQKIDLYAFPGTRLHLDRQDATNTEAADALDNALVSPNVIVNKPVAICFKSGTTDQYALVTIGADARQLSVEMQPMNGSVRDCGI
jgi:type II secretory pathway pseudopilin PulG